MTLVLICLLGLYSVGVTFLLLRALKRLLQFDSIFEAVYPTLVDYAIDLKRLVSREGVLLDHPEVQNFHRRNLKALLDVEHIASSIIETRPKAPRPKSKLPKPDVE